MNLEDKIQEEVTNWKMPKMQSKESAWAAISEKMERKPKIIPLYRRFSRAVAVAASFALILTLGWMYFGADSSQSYSTLKGDYKTIDLPDGSVLTLGPESEVNFNSDWSDSRTVSLKGEAFFQVEKGDKFQVLSPHGSVSVLGTSFNVLSRGNTFEVACKTGKVEVKSGDSARLLTPGLKTRLANGSLANAYSIENEKIDSWMNGEYFFDAIPLLEVFSEIERQYNVEIESSIQINEIFTGPVSLQNLDDALLLVCETMNLQFKILNKNQVLITNK